MTLLSWLRLAAVLLAIAGGGCRFMPNQPYWIEGFGGGRAAHIGAWPEGALAIGPDAILYTYPGPWARAWVGQSSPLLKAIAGSNTAIYAIQTDGQVVRRLGGQWSPLAGSENWRASDISATDDDQLLVVAEGALRRVDGERLGAAPCGSLRLTAVAGVHADQAFALDQSGRVHQIANGGCRAIETPIALLRIAARPGRLLGVGVDGSIWRRRDGAQWQKLPAPIKYRPGRQGFPTEAREVAVSANSSWILDNEGAIFVLSDET